MGGEQAPKRSYGLHIRNKNMKITPIPNRNSRSLGISKLSLGFSFALLSTNVCALDLTPDASRVLSDPAFMPERGQIYAVTNYASGKRTGDGYDFQDTRVSTFTVRTDALTQSLDYGVIDNLSVRINVAYERASNQYDYTIGTNVSRDARGFKDPSFGAKLRVFEQDDDGFNWDWVGTYIPSLISAKEPTQTRDGTVARGGSQGILGTSASYKTRSFTASLTAEASYLGKSELQVSEAQTNTYDPSLEYFFGLSTQTRISEVFAINIGVSRTVRNSLHASARDNYNTATFDLEPGDLTSANAALVWHVVPDTLAAVLSYTHDTYANTKSTNTNPPFFASQFNWATKNESANSVSLSLLYVWD